MQLLAVDDARDPEAGADRICRAAGRPHLFLSYARVLRGGGSEVADPQGQWLRHTDARSGRDGASSTRRSRTSRTRSRAPFMPPMTRAATAGCSPAILASGLPNAASRSGSAPPSPASTWKAMRSRRWSPTRGGSAAMSMCCASASTARASGASSASTCRSTRSRAIRSPCRWQGATIRHGSAGWTRRTLPPIARSATGSGSPPRRSSRAIDNSHRPDDFRHMLKVIKGLFPDGAD